MGLFRKPKLTKQEKEQLKKAEHEAYFKAKLEQAKGKYTAQGRKPSLLQKVGKAAQQISENARKNMEKLERE